MTITVALPEEGIGSILDSRISVSVVLAVHDDSDIEKVVHGARSLENAGVLCEVVVVNHGSSDRTDLRCRELLRWIDAYERLPQAGRVRAFHEGAARALGEVLLVLDPDLGCDPDECLEMLYPILAGSADVVLGVTPRLRGRSSSQAGGSNIGHVAFRAGVLEEVEHLGQVGLDVVLGELSALGWRIEHASAERSFASAPRVVRWC